jgi:hypothetical protein
MNPKIINKKWAWWWHRTYHLGQFSGVDYIIFLPTLFRFSFSLCFPMQRYLCSQILYDNAILQTFTREDGEDLNITGPRLLGHIFR